MSQTISELGVIMDVTDAEGIAPSQSILIGETPALVAGTTGAIGTHDLVKPGTTTPLVLPQGFTVTHTLIRVATDLTAGAGTTFALGKLDDTSTFNADFNAATVYTVYNGWNVTGGRAPYYGTVATPVNVTLEGGSSAKYDVRVGTASAGKLIVYFYMQKTV